MFKNEISTHNPWIPMILTLGNSSTIVCKEIIYIYYVYIAIPRTHFLILRSPCWAWWHTWRLELVKFLEFYIMFIHSWCKLHQFSTENKWFLIVFFFSGMICLEVQDSKGNRRNCTDVPFTDWSTGRCKLGVFLGLWHGSACVVRREIGPIQYGHKVIEDIGTCNYYILLIFFWGVGGKSWSPHPLVWHSALYLFCRASPI